MVDDANDDGPVALELVETLGRIGKIELAADGVLARPELAREDIVDDCDGLMLGVVGVGEVTAFKECGADGGEVSRAEWNGGRP